MRVTISGPEVIGELRPLWLALLHHHATIGEHLGPVRDDGESWRLRSASYAEWLREDGAFVVVARDDDGRAVGYAVCTARGPSPTWVELTPAVSVADLAVLPGARRGGVGRALLDAALDHAGLDRMELTVVATNASARAFYGALGFEDMFIEMRRDRRRRR